MWLLQVLAQSDNRGVIYSFAIPATTDATTTTTTTTSAPAAVIPAVRPAAADEKTLRASDVTADDRYNSYMDRLRQQEAERRARRLRQERQYGRAVAGNTTYNRAQHSNRNRGLYHYANGRTTSRSRFTQPTPARPDNTQQQLSNNRYSNREVTSRYSQNNQVQRNQGNGYYSGTRYVTGR